MRHFATALMLLLTACAHGEAARVPTPTAPPTLAIPFQLHGHAGTVAFEYGPNRDPRKAGFDILGLPFPLEDTLGFPTFDAKVHYEGTGYRAIMGWVQIVTVRDTKTGAEDTSVDKLPWFRNGAEVPFASLGSAPEVFDAPGPNPPRTDATWTAFTFLTVLPSGRSRRLQPVLAVKWGYTLVAGKATPTPLVQVPLAEWDRLAPVLREDCPHWELLPSTSPVP